MQDRVMDLTQPPAKTGAQALPKRRLFVLGGGTPVPPDASDAFYDALVGGCLDGKVIGHYEFALGWAACIDACARGTIDFSRDPIETVNQAFADIENITTEPNKITDVMRVG